MSDLEQAKNDASWAGRGDGYNRKPRAKYGDARLQEAYDCGYEVGQGEVNEKWAS